jgi:hypothetical protein
MPPPINKVAREHLNQMKKQLLAVLAYMVPTFPLGYLWHLTVFAEYYKSLHVYRDSMIIPFGILSMLIQGIIWSVIYARLFSGEPILKGAMKFAALACPLAWTYMVLAVSAKHHMSSVGGFLAIETAFVLVHYAVVSPLIATVYSRKS